MIRQLNHPHRAMAPYRHKQRKQHLFQLDAGCLEDLLIAQRLVHYADDIQQRGVKVGNVVVIMCILHVLIFRV